MQNHVLYTLKKRGFYILILLLVIVLAVITIYLSNRRMQELDKDKPALGMNPLPNPFLYDHTFYHLINN